MLPFQFLADITSTPLSTRSVRISTPEIPKTLPPPAKGQKPLKGKGLDVEIEMAFDENSRFEFSKNVEAFTLSAILVRYPD